MLEAASDNISWGLEYLKQHPMHHQNAYEAFFGGVIETINYSKGLNKSGTTTGPLLDPITKDLERVKADLSRGVSSDETKIAEYIDVALEEVYFARYLEESVSAESRHHGPNYDKPGYDFWPHDSIYAEAPSHDYSVPMFHDNEKAASEGVEKQPKSQAKVSKIAAKTPVAAEKPVAKTSPLELIASPEPKA